MGHLEVVQELLAKGANIAATSNDGSTARVCGRGSFIGKVFSFLFIKILLDDIFE